MAKVIRIPVQNPNPTVDDPPCVLVHVEASKAAGSKPLEFASLDLKLVATENDGAYANEVHTLRSKNSPVNEDEWEHVLKLVLHGEVLPDSQIEAVAIVNDRNEKKRIDITIRKNVEGITSRLGTISLAYDPKEEEVIDIFDWAGSLALDLQSTKLALSESCTRSDQQKESIFKLQKQIEDLSIAKSNHETELLSKFRDLLNEKKAKIRDQQRLLTGSNIDLENTTGLEDVPKKNTKAAASSSRKGKRKANEKDAAQADSDDNGAERMDVDPEPDSDQDEDEAEQNTTDEGGETTDEDDDSPVEMPAPGKSKAAASNNTRSAKSSIQPPAASGSAAEDLPPPPRRLPFQEKTKKPAEVPAPVDADDGDETASDDEL